LNELEAAETMPGDLLVLAEGDAVSADARLVQAASLTVAEASLTGESEAVLKEVATIAEPASLGDRLVALHRAGEHRPLGRRGEEAPGAVGAGVDGAVAMGAPPPGCAATSLDAHFIAVGAYLPAWE
jgi:magnesium-transporting ATPase (P-type)